MDKLPAFFRSSAILTKKGGCRWPRDSEEMTVGRTWKGMTHISLLRWKFSEVALMEGQRHMIYVWIFRIIPHLTPSPSFNSSNCLRKKNCSSHRHSRKGFATVCTSKSSCPSSGWQLAKTPALCRSKPRVHNQIPAWSPVLCEDCSLSSPRES
jgi:hypothetical protein